MVLTQFTQKEVSNYLLFYNFGEAIMNYYKKRLAFLSLFGFISALISVVGIIFYFVNPIVTIICAAFSIINSILQVFIGEQNNFSTEIFTIIIAVIIALIAKISFINTICFALCIADALLQIIGWIFMAFQKDR